MGPGVAALNRRKSCCSAIPTCLPPGRHAEEEALALRSALSAAESRLAEMEALEADVVSRGHQINECQEGAMALKNALSNANFRLAGMDALGADMKARTEELEECQQKRRSSEEDLVKERGRTQHLVSGAGGGGAIPCTHRHAIVSGWPVCPVCL